MFVCVTEHWSKKIRWVQHRNTANEITRRVDNLVYLELVKRIKGFYPVLICIVQAIKNLVLSRRKINKLIELIPPTKTPEDVHPHPQKLRHDPWAGKILPIQHLCLPESKMADVLLFRSSCGFRIFFTSRCRFWRSIQHLRTLTGMSKSIMNLNLTEKEKSNHNESCETPLAASSFLHLCNQLMPKCNDSGMWLTSTAKACPTTF